jgi:hypothetical protein
MSDRAFAYAAPLSLAARYDAPMPSRQVDDPELLLAVLQRHSLACPVCGYDVRRLERPQCPECGSRLNLHLGSPDLKLHHLVAAIVGPALGLGFNANIGLMLAVQMLRGVSVRPAVSWALVYSAATSLVLLAVIVLIVTGRRRFLSWRRGRQQLVAVMLVFIALACAGGMIFFAVAAW